MRQAPPQYAVIGRGKMAEHFCHYLDLSGVSFVRWGRQDPVSLASQLADVSTVLLLISDQAIEPFIKENPGLKEKTLLHFSGAHVVPGLVGLHPLFSFADQLYELSVYQSVLFGIDQPNTTFQDFFPSLNNPSFFIEPSKKPYYHALCVMANNFTTLLWRKFFSEMEHQFHLDSKLIEPFLEKTVENIKRNIGGALTGPLARGDQLTIEKNTAALSEDPYQIVYQAFVKALEREMSYEKRT